MSPSDDKDPDHDGRTSNGTGEGEPSSTNRMVNRRGRVWVSRGCRRKRKIVEMSSWGSWVCQQAKMW
jgi:hypothetical protein